MLIWLADESWACGYSAHHQCDHHQICFKAKQADLVNCRKYETQVMRTSWLYCKLYRKAGDLLLCHTLSMDPVGLFTLLPEIEHWSVVTFMNDKKASAAFSLLHKCVNSKGKQDPVYWVTATSSNTWYRLNSGSIMESELNSSTGFVSDLLSTYLTAKERTSCMVKQMSKSLRNRKSENVT